MSESTERERPELLPCPWCDEQDFDLIGLKSHVLRGDCVQFDGTPGVAFVTRRSEGPAGAYEHPEHGLTCPIGGCSLRVEGSGDGTCYYVPTPPELARGSGDLQRREAPDSPEGGTGPASAATAAPELDRCADGDGDVSRDAPIRPRVGGSSRGEDDPRAASSAPAPERRSGKDRRVENGGWASRPSRSGIDRRASQQEQDGAAGSVAPSPSGEPPKYPERDTIEQQARGILFRMGFNRAYELAAGEVTELADLLVERNELEQAVAALRTPASVVQPQVSLRAIADEIYEQVGGVCGSDDVAVAERVYSPSTSPQASWSGRGM